MINIDFASIIKVFLGSKHRLKANLLQAILSNQANQVELGPFAAILQEYLLGLKWLLLFQYSIHFCFQNLRSYMTQELLLRS